MKEEERRAALVGAGAAELENHRLQHARATRRANLLAGSTRPIVIGPWCGEVGFELLYWIPFLNWMTERARLEGRAMTVVTRGGAHAWYRHLADRGVEILDQVTVDEFRGHARTLKQDHLSAFDRGLLRRVVRDQAIARPQLLHPLLMYRLFIPYWKEEPVLEPIGSFLRYRTLAPAPSHPVLDGLPGEYYAVKFYFSHAFPDTAANRAFVRHFVGSLSEQLPVVVLRGGSRVDDHEDALIADGPRVITIETDVRDNLAAQSALVCRARAFAGTYGGFSYLAPLYGVNSLSFFSERDKLVPFHLDHAQRIFGAMDGGRFVALDVADASFAAMALARLADATARPA